MVEVEGMMLLVCTRITDFHSFFTHFFAFFFFLSPFCSIIFIFKTKIKIIKPNKIVTLREFPD